MKKIIASLAAAAAIAFAGAASAASLQGDYVQAQGGAQFADQYNGGAAWSVAAGRDFGLVRGEVEYLGANLGHFGSLASVNVNGYIQPFTFHKITPFVGGGVGYGSALGRNVALLNAQVGASYPLVDHLKAVVAYRYTTAMANGNGTDTSAVTAGLRYTF